MEQELRQGTRSLILPCGGFIPPCFLAISVPSVLNFFLEWTCRQHSVGTISKTLPSASPTSIPTPIHSPSASRTCTNGSPSSPASPAILRPPMKPSSKPSKWPGTKNFKTARPSELLSPHVAQARQNL